MPVLRGHEPSAPENVVLREHLGPSDIREIYRAINRDGKLDSLRPYLESASDAEMSELADVLSRFVYEDAYRSDSLVSLLRAETSRKGFSGWRDAVRRWQSRPGFRDEKAGLWDLIGLDEFPRLVRHDIGFLDPDWLSTAISTWHRAADYHERGPWPDEQGIPTLRAVDDLARLIDTMSDKQAKDLAFTLRSSDFGTTLLKAAAAHGKRFGAAGFEGFARGMAKLVASGKPKNDLERLAELARELDGPSGGMFEQMEEKLQDRELARQLSTYLRGPLVGGTAGVMRETFVRLESQGRQHGKQFWLGASSAGGKPNQAFVDLFSDLRESLDVATKPVVRLDGEDEGDGFVARAPVYLHAYALAKWLEHVVGENKAALEKSPEAAFGGKAWDIEIQSAGWELRLAEEKDDKPVLLASARAELTAMGLGDFAAALAATAPQEKMRRFTYTFPPIEKKPLREAFRDALAACDDARALANLSPALVSLAYSLTSAESKSSFHIRDLETDNLLDSINRLVPRDYDAWRKLESLLFDWIGVGDLPSGARELLLGFFQGDQLRRVTAILDSIQLFREFDRPVGPGLPSPFAFYHQGLVFSRPEEIHSHAALFRFCADTGLFSSRYPAFQGFVKNGKGLGKFAYSLSLVPRDRWEKFLAPIAEMFDADASLETHLGVLRRLLPIHRTALASAYDALSATGLSAPTDPTTRAELRWLQAFVKEGGLETVWGYFGRHGSREELLGAVRELKALSRKGYLQDAFYLLAHIRDERMARIALALREWDASGELVATLELIEASL